MIEVQYHRYLWIVVAVHVDENRKTTVGFGVTEGAAKRHLLTEMKAR